MLSCISHRGFTAAVMGLCKIGATESLLISEPVCCFKCVCWDRGWETKWTSSQEKVHSVIWPTVFLSRHFLVCIVKIWDKWIWQLARLVTFSVISIQLQHVEDDPQSIIHRLHNLTALWVKTRVRTKTHTEGIKPTTFLLYVKCTTVFTNYQK